MTKLVVFELKDDVDLGWVVSSLADKTTRLAVVGSAPGIFSSLSTTSATSSPPKVLSSARELPSGASNATTSQEVKPVIAPVVPYKRPRKETRKESQNTVEDSKEDHLMETSFRDETYVEEEEFVDVEFVDAADTSDINHTPESKSLPKKRKRRLMKSGDFVYSTPRKSSDYKTVYCKLCQSAMTVRSSYGRSRLREHVLRHLNTPTVKCGLCGAKFPVRQRIYLHQKMKHAGEELTCIDLPRPDDFDEKYTNLWKNCFPNTEAMALSRKPIEGSLDDKRDSDAACGAEPSAVLLSPLPTDSKSLIAHMEKLLGQAEKSLQIMQEPSEKIEMKPVVGCLPEEAEDPKDQDLTHTAFRDESYVEEEESVDVEFVEAADTPDNHTPESKSLPKKRNRRLMTRKEFFYSTPKKSSENKENTVFCKLCQSEMTVRSSYGRSRLREHVLRHLNIYTAKCGLCGLKGALREQIRHHHKNKHAGEKRICIDLPRPDDLDEKYMNLWKTCFPNTEVMALFRKKPTEGFPDDKTDSDTACGAVPSATDSKSIIAHMEKLLGQAEKSLQIKQEPSEEIEMKPFVGHLHEEAEELYEEAEDPYAGYTSC